MGRFYSSPPVSGDARDLCLLRPAVDELPALGTVCLRGLSLQRAATIQLSDIDRETKDPREGIQLPPGITYAA